MLCPITPVPIQPIFVFPGAMFSDMEFPLASDRRERLMR
jgi:hypothetical protein